MRSGAIQIVLLLQGLRSNSCRERIAEVLGRVKGVEDVSVSLIRARAVVYCVPPCDIAELIEVINAAGYAAAVEGA